MENQEEQLEMWDQATAPPETALTVEQMDQMIVQLREAKSMADIAEESAKTIKAEYDAKRKEVLDALKTLNRDNYSVAGAGMAYISRKEVYTVPKTHQEKTALFNYIKEKYGPDALMSMVGIHSATLTSWANKETESGEVMQIPGLEQPTMIETLNFRKKD